MPTKTPTDRNRSTRATAARAAHAASAINYREVHGAGLPPAATSTPTFSALAGSIVAGDVAEHARLVAIHRDARAAQDAHTASRREAEALDATALAESVTTGTADPGPVHVAAHQAEADRLCRYADGASTALLGAYKALTDAIRDQADELTASSAAEAATHRAALHAATAAVAAEAAELDRIAGQDRAVANVLERRWTEIRVLPRPVSRFPVMHDRNTRPVYADDLVQLLNGYREATPDV